MSRTYPEMFQDIFRTNPGNILIYKGPAKTNKRRDERDWRSDGQKTVLQLAWDGEAQLHTGYWKATRGGGVHDRRMFLRDFPKDSFQHVRTYMFSIENNNSNVLIVTAWSSWGLRMVLDGLEFRKFREACRKNSHLVAPLEKFELTSYDQKQKSQRLKYQRLL